MNGKKSLVIISQIITDMPPQTTASETVVSQRKEEIIKEAKRIEESSLYSSKGHFSAAAFWRRLHFYLGLPATVLAAVAAASAFSQFDSGHTVGGWISICVAALSGLSTFLNPNEKAVSHLAAANNFDALQSKARIFWTVDCRGNDSDQVLTNRLKDLAEEKSELNRKSPQIPRFAYITAKKGIAAGEADYRVDKPAS
jgi:hypothetical protein